MSKDKNEQRLVQLVQTHEDSDRIDLGHPPPKALIEAHMQAASVPQAPPIRPPAASADSGKSATPPDSQGDS